MIRIQMIKRKTKKVVKITKSKLNQLKRKMSNHLNKNLMNKKENSKKNLVKPN